MSVSTTERKEQTPFNGILIRNKRTGERAYVQNLHPVSPTYNYVMNQYISIYKLFIHVQFQSVIP